MANSPSSVIDIETIIQMLPHRYPFLLVDRVTDVTAGERLTAIKNVTFNEPQFTGHFPDKPIMPGVLIIEAIAQAAGLLALHTLGVTGVADKLVYFMSIENAKFRTPVTPGDTMVMEIHCLQRRREVWKMKGEVSVGDKKVAEAVVSAMIVDK